MPSVLQACGWRAWATSLVVHGAWRQAASKQLLPLRTHHASSFAALIEFLDCGDPIATPHAHSSALLFHHTSALLLHHTRGTHRAHYNY